jgi:hypothetical protein
LLYFVQRLFMIIYTVTKKLSVSLCVFVRRFREDPRLGGRAHLDNDDYIRRGGREHATEDARA